MGTRGKPNGRKWGGKCPGVITSVTASGPTGLGEGERESGSFSGLAFGPHAPAAALDNALADREPQSGAGILVPMETLKQAEDAVGILLLEANAVVADGDHPLIAILFRGD